MEIIEVPDIFIYKDNELHSMRNQKIVKDGKLNNFVTGCGIVKNEKLWVLGSSSLLVQMTTLNANPNFSLTGQGDIIVDWGDDSVETNVFSHSYSDNLEEHTIKLYGIAIETLLCESNQLTTIDVSRDTALRHFSCYDNKLTSLDISQNVMMEVFSCGINQLRFLDVSKNTILKQLNCERNQLTFLDISHNLKLITIVCPNNQLGTLDVSKNTALIHLACTDNQITCLDISENRALEVLFCPNNQLGALDVSKNTALREINCNGNNLTVLDVSHNTTLKQIGCAYNPFVNNEPALVSLANSLPQRKVNDKGDLALSSSTSAAWIQEICDAKNWTVY